jgi:putative protease
LREKAYLCVATGEYDGDMAWFVQRNKVIEGDACEIITPGECGKPFVATELYNEKGEKIESAPHPSMRFKMRVPFPVKAGDIVRSSDK